MRSYTFFILFLFFVGNHFVSAQESEQRVVHLKDGSVLSGKVIEDNEYLIKIIIETGDTLTIGYKHIDQGEGKRKVKPSGPLGYKDKGGFIMVGFRQLFQRQHSYEINVVAGNHFSNRWSLALEAGYLKRPDIIVNTYLQSNFVNLGAHLKYNIKVSKPRVFLAGQIGYGFVVNDNRFFGQFGSDVDGGLQGAISTGLQLASRTSSRFLFTGGVNFNEASGLINSFDHQNGEVMIEFTKTYVSPFVGVMIEF